MNRDCDEKCTCNRGEWICEPRCSGNTFKRGSKTFENNTNCYEKVTEEDDCCAIMTCNDKPEENGEYGNTCLKTLKDGSAVLLKIIF